MKTTKATLPGGFLLRKRGRRRGWMAEEHMRINSVKA
jgi:hypothetical protein